MLKKSNVIVTFIKVADGTTRTAVMTKKTDVPAPAATDQEKKHRTELPDVFHFYSKHDEGWRSFRLPNLISYSIA